ncbi:regulatory protein RecX [Motiliproteus sp. MSK22-1]|uniref:regulatory protein RecX n=1 Tax=Motiliproteus sp. MSK22-1 TaxID=1897630 RepID=UPI0009783DBF|nr:regulatory protein RecX [Motiliproteus sp. MSK22-1]OMH28375.1 hypothetical protein BGP75_20970 [Motiliproteus sp. MSK22-1]
MKGDDADIRNSALGLLARREHSRKELVDKLMRRTRDLGQVESLLDQLHEQGLQSDSRFAESFVRSRVSRGQGPSRIQQDLRQRGVCQDIISRVMEEQDVDWYRVALEVRCKRFGMEKPVDRKAYAQQVRFLLYRGFSYDQVQEAIKVAQEDLEQC